MSPGVRFKWQYFSLALSLLIFQGYKHIKVKKKLSDGLPWDLKILDWSICPLVYNSWLTVRGRKEEQHFIVLKGVKTTHRYIVYIHTYEHIYIALVGWYIDKAYFQFTQGRHNDNFWLQAYVWLWDAEILIVAPDSLIAYSLYFSTTGWRERFWPPYIY